MEPPGGTHTTTDLYSKLSADPTIFAKLRIKSASISLNGLGVNFFRLYPQLCGVLLGVRVFFPFPFLLIPAPRYKKQMYGDWRN